MNNPKYSNEDDDFQHLAEFLFGGQSGVGNGRISIRFYKNASNTCAPGEFVEVQGCTVNDAHIAVSKHKFVATSNSETFEYLCNGRTRVEVDLFEEEEESPNAYCMNGFYLHIDRKYPGEVAVNNGAGTEDCITMEDEDLQDIAKKILEYNGWEFKDGD